MIEPLAQSFYKLLSGGATQTANDSTLADLRTAIEAYGKNPPGNGRGFFDRQRLVQYARALATAFMWKKAEEKYGHTMRDDIKTITAGRKKVTQQGQSMTYHVMPDAAGQNQEFRMWRSPDGEVYPIHPRIKPL